MRNQIHKKLSGKSSSVVANKVLSQLGPEPGVVVKGKVGKHSVWMFHGDDASSYAPIRYNCSDPFTLLLFPRNRPT